MQFLFILVPLAAFFIGYTLYDIYVATIVLMFLAPVMLLIEWLKDRTIKKMHIWVTVMLLVLGTITVALRDPVFIQWKLSLVHWLFAAVLLGSQYLGKKPGIQTMMELAIKDAGTGEDEVALDMSDTQWRRFNMAWFFYFVFVGVLNLYVAYNFDEAIWVKFKVFGIIGLQIVFMLGAVVWLFRHISETETAKETAAAEQTGE